MLTKMKLIWCLLIAAAACSINAERIVGGQPTTINQYPSIVQVDFRTAVIWGQSCAANIINTRYVISAAHCFEGILFSINSRRIRAGSTNRNSGGTVIYLRRRVNHPSYGSRGMDGDICVCELQSALTYSNTIRQIAIPSQGFEAPDSRAVVHAGWGVTRESGFSSSVLRDVTIYTVNRAVCNQRYGGSITVNMICAGVLDVGGRDACQGDSGGPLYMDNILLGIVSFGRGCAQARFPGVSTRVSSYTNWIVSTAR